MLRSSVGADGDTLLSNATAFIWECDGAWYLVTNIHNLSGWNHQENKAVSSRGSQPTHIEFQLCAVAADQVSGTSLLSRKGYRLPLYDDEQPKWLVHPVFQSTVDVGILPICDAPNEEDCNAVGVGRFATLAVNCHEWDVFDLAAGDDAFVLGFPKGMNAIGFPIWKRASIATEPDIDLDGLPKLLLDTATREGMSGSPVIGIRRGITNPSGSFGSDSIIGESIQFVGIYSGRIGDDPLGVQLGIVWKSSVIDEIIEGNVHGEMPWG